MKKFGTSVLVALFATFFTSTNAIAGSVPTPETIEGIPTVSVEEAKKLVDEGATPVDCRKKIEFMEERLPGAVSVPYKEKSEKVADFDMSKDKFKIEKVVPNKETPLLTYCNGITCWKSYKCAVVAKKRGYAKVYRLRTGIPAWKEKGYPTE